MRIAADGWAHGVERTSLEDGLMHERWRMRVGASDLDAARAQLAAASLLLPDTAIPGRRAETLWRVGRTDLRSGREA